MLGVPIKEILGVPEVSWEKVIDLVVPVGEVKLNSYVRPVAPGGIVRTIWLGLIDTTLMGMLFPDVRSDILL